MVLMQVDEAGRNDRPRGIHNAVEIAIGLCAGRADRRNRTVIVDGDKARRNHLTAEVHRHKATIVQENAHLTYP